MAAHLQVRLQARHQLGVLAVGGQPQRAQQRPQLCSAHFCRCHCLGALRRAVRFEHLPRRQLRDQGRRTGQAKVEDSGNKEAAHSTSCCLRSELTESPCIQSSPSGKCALHSTHSTTQTGSKALHHDQQGQESFKMCDGMAANDAALKTFRHPHCAQGTLKRLQAAGCRRAHPRGDRRRQRLGPAAATAACR